MKFKDIGSESLTYVLARKLLQRRDSAPKDRCRGGREASLQLIWNYEGFYLIQVVDFVSVQGYLFVPKSSC